RGGIMLQVNVDAVPSLIRAGDLRHGPVDLAGLGRAVGQTDDAADRKAPLRLADVSAMAAAVEAVDHEIAPVALFVCKPAGDDTADDRSGGPAVDRIELRRPLELGLRHRTVHRLDDVA